MAEPALMVISKVKKLIKKLFMKLPVDKDSKIQGRPFGPIEF
jgi:hypothetical protein